MLPLPSHFGAHRSLRSFLGHNARLLLIQEAAHEVVGINDARRGRRFYDVCRRGRIPVLVLVDAHGVVAAAHLVGIAFAGVRA